MRKSGVSKYDIEVGMIFKFPKPIIKYNKNFNASKGPRGRGVKIGHTTYIWVQRESFVPSGKDEKCKKLWIYTVWVPNINGMEERYLHKRSHVERIYICKLLKNQEYEIMKEGVKFDGRQEDYLPAMKAIGVL